MKLSVLLFTAFLSSPSLAMKQIKHTDLTLETGIKVTAIKVQALKSTTFERLYQQIHFGEQNLSASRHIAAKKVN